jgi:hypothetical protein
MGWCVSWASVTMSAMVSWICIVQARACSLRATSFSAGARYCRMAAVWPMTNSPSLRKGGAKGGWRRLRSAERAQQGRHSAARVLRAPRDVHVRRAGRFERQADEFAATCDRRPVVQQE